MTKVPVLFIVFNRPNVTKRVYQSLLDNENISKIYVSCDGPRQNKTDEKKINDVKSIISKNTTKKEVITRYSEINLGCKYGVKSAIDWFFEHEEAGVIIEDDCLPSNTFMKYCGELLSKYKGSEDIFAIDGSNYSAISSEKDSYAFSKYTMIWGWATWRDKWSKMDLNMKDIDQFYNGKFKSIFKTYNERFYWKTHLDNIVNGNIDTWDFQWMYSIWKNNGKVISPCINMVKNLGFGIDATHSKSSRNLFEDAKCNNIQFPLSHPEFIDFDKELDHKLSKIRFKITLKANLLRLIKKFK